MNRMAKIWCTVPRIILVGVSYNLQSIRRAPQRKSILPESVKTNLLRRKRPILAEMAPGHRMASSQPRKDFWWRLS